MELRDYIDILYNRKWIVVGTLCVVLAVALVFSFVQAPVYQSSVKILVDKGSSSEAALGELLPASLSDTERFIQNQSQIIQTDALAREVEKQLQYQAEQSSREDGSSSTLARKDVPSAASLQSMVSVRLGAKTGIFDIVVDGGDPALTREVARAYAEEYLSNRQLAAIKQISEARKEVWNRLTEVEEQVLQIAQESKQYKAGEVPVELVAAAQQSAALWATLYEKYISLRISESLEQRGLEIIEASASGEKVSPRPLRNGILAVFLGLILGVGLAFFVDYMDDSLRSREDFERYYDTSIVGEIPFIPREELDEFHVVYFEKPKHQAAEGFRTLRTNLQFLDLKGNVILFTSALPEEGKSTVAASLGAALSEMGKKVLLVDCDLRKPTLHRMFDIPDEVGVTGVLAGTVSLEKAIQPTENENLYVLPCGVRPPNPGKLAASDEMRSLLEKARGLVDYVLVDSPPMLAASDAPALAHVVDGVMLIGRMKIADRESAKRTMELLRKVEANILGIVVNCLEMGKRYGYYHYYYYSYEGEVEGQASGAGGKGRGRRHKSKKPARTTSPPEG